MFSQHFIIISFHYNFCSFSLPPVNLLSLGIHSEPGFIEVYLYSSCCECAYTMQQWFIVTVPVEFKQHVQRRYLIMNETYDKLLNFKMEICKKFYFWISNWNFFNILYFPSHHYLIISSKNSKSKMFLQKTFFLRSIEIDKKLLFIE